MSCDTWRDRLAAYADGELSSSESTEVANHLRQCARCTAAALENAQMKRSVAIAGKRFAPSAEFRSKILSSTGRKPARGGNWMWKLVLAPAVVVVLLSLGFNLYVNRQKSNRERVYSELADLHVSTLASATPVDVVSTDRHTVKPWFEGRLPFSFNLPELQGTDFTLLGGRVTYLGQTPGAQLIYKLRKHEISVFVFQDRDEVASVSSTPVEQFSFHVEGWNKNGLRYFVIGDVSADDVDSLSRLFRNAG